MTADAVLAQGAAALQRGDLRDAAACFASVLQDQPEHVDALQLLGLTAVRMGHAVDGLELIDRALALDKRHAPALANRALALESLGRTDEAIEALRRALRIRADFPPAQLRLARLVAPRDPDQARALATRVTRAHPESWRAWHLIGTIALEGGRPAEAAEALAHAVTIAPDQAALHALLGVARRDAGDLVGSLTALRRGLHLAPDDPGTRAALAVSLAQAGETAEAAAAWRALIAEAPQQRDAWLALGRLLRDAGHADEAVSSYRRALTHHPDDPAILNDLASALSLTGAAIEAEAVWRDLLDRDASQAGAWHNLGGALVARGAFAEGIAAHRAAVAEAPWDRVAWIGLADALAQAPELPTDLAVELEQLLDVEGVEHQAVERAVRRVLEADPRWSERVAALRADAAASLVEGAESLLERPLVTRWLSRTLVTEIGWEHLLTELRRRVLAEPDRVPLDAIAALAIQCFHTEYAWLVGPDEIHALSRVDRSTPLGWATAALYVAPTTAPPPGPDHGLWLELVEVVWDVPARERELAARVPTLALTADEVSEAVRAQYEENPYPRLVSQHRKRPAPWRGLLRSLLPHVSDWGDLPATPEILIAGGGTGLQIRAAAQRYAGAKVVAVDLSRASLAAALRRLQDWELADQVELLQADILALDALEHSFDLVEAGGVLHHMADPLAAWAVLVRRTRVGGLMKIGLYSELARTGVVAARDLAAEQGWTPTADGIRAARASIAALPPEHPARAVLFSPDFFSLSGCRDLFLHACEHRFTIPSLRAAHEVLGLEFLGFQHANRAAGGLLEQVVPGASPADLEAWEAVERAHPHLFAGMYQFWSRRRA